MHYLASLSLQCRRTAFSWIFAYGPIFFLILIKRNEQFLLIIAGFSFILCSSALEFGLMGYLNLVFLLALSCLIFLPTTYELQNSQTQLLLQIRKYLEYPSSLQVLQSYSGDLCYIPPSEHLSILCLNNSVTELRIKGDRLLKATNFNGFSVPNRTLSEIFSIDSLVTTLTRLTSLRVLSLVSLGIWGQLPDKIHRFSSLEILDLSSNYIFGLIPAKISTMVELNTIVLDGNYFNDTFPDWLDSLSNLTILHLKNNQLKGQLPSSLCKITTLTDVALSHNGLSGELPDLSTLINLHVLDLRENQFESELPDLPKVLVTALLSKNMFSGNIPEKFADMVQLQHLDLSFNSLTGPPPPLLFYLPNITYLDLAFNKLSGFFQDNLNCAGKLGFVDISNNKLVGDLPSCLGNSSEKRMVKFSGNCFSNPAEHQHQASFCAGSLMKSEKSNSKEIALMVAIISGAVLVLVLLVLGVLFLYRRRRKNNLSRKFEPNNLPKVMQDNPPAGVSSEILANARFISQAVKLGAQASPICRPFSIEELKEATNNFDKSMFLGEGSIGKVYRGELENGTFVAIRRLALPKKYSVQKLKVQLDLLSKLHHPHLVGLLGHCIDGFVQDDSSSNEIFFVYEYLSNGNYRNFLSENCQEKILNWTERLTVLIGVAKAIHFLHTGVIPGSFNNRLRTNNILIDEHQISKLSDYGMSIIIEEIEKLETKGEGTRSRYKTQTQDDVYNFGYILLETLVGPVTNKAETFLLNDMASFGSQDGRRRIVDPIVLTTSSQESLSRVISITRKCISPEMSNRPSFEDVLWNLQYAAQVQAVADADQKSDSISLS